MVQLYLASLYLTIAKIFLLKKDVLVCATKSLNKLNWTLEMVEKVCFSKRKHFLFAGLHRYERLDHKLRSVCGQCQHFFKSKLTQCNTNAM